MQLISDSESYVQHLRWSGAVADSDAKLQKVAVACKRAAGLRVQVCSPSLCGAEAAFGARIGASSESPSPSLRLCISAEHSAGDINNATAALKAALREVA
jgi:7-keto-8-aminopelargonate synthetase-like enzyme